MAYTLLYHYLPELAEKETRSITVFGSNEFNLPAARYYFHEMFCDEKGCDCRRAFFTVMSSNHTDFAVAVIAWGWETREYYAKWLGANVPSAINELIGPVLNSASPQSKLAPAILKLFQKILLSDQAYVDRVKRHYAMFREIVDGAVKKNARKKSRRKK
jgi:hypothetical protein